MKTKRQFSVEVQDGLRQDERGVFPTRAEAEREAIEVVRQRPDGTRMARVVEETAGSDDRVVSRYTVVMRPVLRAKKDDGPWTEKPLTLPQRNPSRRKKAKARR